MSRLQLTLNGRPVELEVPESRYLAEVLREDLGLTGTKIGCNEAECGICTVLVDGNAVQSCLVPAVALTGKKITTIEGLSPDGDHPVQRAWNEVDVPQCGYCQAGQVLTAVSLLQRHPDPDDAHPNEPATA